ncbi:MAG: hypothetical protein ACLRFJ_02705 [Alphaproteobacteria bacterium]
MGLFKNIKTLFGVEKPVVEKKVETKPAFVDTPLTHKASRSFNHYLEQYLGCSIYGIQIGFPKQRLTDQEWNELNDYIAKFGLEMISKKHKNGAMFMCFSRIGRHQAIQEYIENLYTDFKSTPLTKKAGDYFDNDFRCFLKGQPVKSGFLPKQRLTDQEWDELNNAIAEYGVKMVARKHANNRFYMCFTNISDEGKLRQNGDECFTNAAKTATNIADEEKLPEHLTKTFYKIKELYPNIPDRAVRQMLTNPNAKIYDLIRKTDVPYDSMQEDFEDAVFYALETASRDLLEDPYRNGWQNICLKEKSITGTKYNPKIHMYGYQGGTWTREYSNSYNQLQKTIKYHISLNVDITKELLVGLDNIVIADAGKTIAYYKFPKLGGYKEVIHRHDPVTIYTYDRNPVLEQEITRLASIYARSNDGLIGTVLAKGVSIEKETNDGNISVGELAAQRIQSIIRGR